ncbi:hypothetical protein PL75_01915 [Neisseria arctica]|uniref:Uncharacterized protein n=1 Tax=Neisseria arctica TaxID=1470200 RepID=A0A0J0YUA9_9NEIS|nr:hypothetical protein [Neisseria arctica]KLT73722.1 hypothetical protein PL75_01915 [Neisseria arctica]UOO85859.1 hypothetical protein LVJ86_06340 [Neisseria arctica]
MNHSNQLTTFNQQLPDLSANTIPAINQLVTSLGFPREVLASDEEIRYAWSDLPRELRNIPVNNVAPELIARMCIATSSGLFDGAINYIWNAAILRLRDKVRNFGLPIVSQIREKDFEDNNLISLQDSQLLDLCLELNILNEEGFLFLSQCRNIRNNFSAAHPSLGNLNDREFITFLNRCIKYALGDSSSPKGVNINEFIKSLKEVRFSEPQLELWRNRLSETHEAQRQLLIMMAHGVYCDSKSQERTRLNALDICSLFKDSFSASLRSSLIDKHSEYIAKGDEQRLTASSQFFEKLGLLGLLSAPQQHTIFSTAVQRLQIAHDGLNNFYNEAPHAERLLELSTATAVPETIQSDFVDTVVSCYLGNGYGISWAAIPFYEEIIKNFSPMEIAIMLRHAQSETSRIARMIPHERRRFVKALALIDPASVPHSVKIIYDQFTTS